MEGSAQESVGTQSSWLRCYRCWSQNLEVQLHYEGILKVDADTGEAVDPVEEVQEAVVQCLDCLHDQPHLALTFYDEDGRRISRIEPVEDRWERMVTGTPWVASCTVTVDADQVESCSGPDAAESLAFAAFGDHGTREFFTHVRFHKHEDDRIVIHMLVELYARSSDEATDVMARGRPRRADDHLTRRGVTPAGLEPGRGALAPAPVAITPRAASASISSALRPSSPSTSAVCSPRSGGGVAVGAGGAPDRRGHEVERAGGGVLDASPSPGGRPRPPRRARRAPSAPSPQGTPAASRSASQSSAERSRKRSSSSGTSSFRCSTRAALVAKRSSELSSSRPMTEHSAAEQSVVRGGHRDPA